MCVAKCDPQVADFKVVKQGNGKNCVIVMDGSGFSFSKHNNHIWRCSKRRTHKCSAMLKIQEGWIISWKNGHSHEPKEWQNAVSVKFEDTAVQKYF